MSEITETCPHCYGTGWWGDNGKNVCPHCDGEGEVSANPPTCKSCGKALRDHIGHEGLCRQLEEAKAIIKRFIERAENECLLEPAYESISYLIEELASAKKFLKVLES